MPLALDFELGVFAAASSEMLARQHLFWTSVKLTQKLRR